MQHFANFGIVKKANKALKRLNETKGFYMQGTGEGLGEIARTTANKQLPQWKSQEQKKKVYDGRREQLASGLTRKRRQAQYEAEKWGTVPIKPALRSSSERLDFSPTTEQLEGIYNKHYAKGNRNANKYDPKLITGSANHTWLTADGKYMEIPVGQQEMPLNASMWKGRKSGIRLPDTEVKGLGQEGSPVLGITGGSIKTNTGKIYKSALSGKLIQGNQNYNSQIANKRYVPNE
jgi:hypothetical protein